MWSADYLVASIIIIMHRETEREGSDGQKQIWKRYDKLINNIVTVFLTYTAVGRRDLKWDSQFLCIPRAWAYVEGNKYKIIYSLGNVPIDPIMLDITTPFRLWGGSILHNSIATIANVHTYCLAIHPELIWPCLNQTKLSWTELNWLPSLFNMPPEPAHQTRLDRRQILICTAVVLLSVAGYEHLRHRRRMRERRRREEIGLRGIPVRRAVVVGWLTSLLELGWVLGHEFFFSLSLDSLLSRFWCWYFGFM